MFCEPSRVIFGSSSMLDTMAPLVSSFTMTVRNFRFSNFGCLLTPPLLKRKRRSFSSSPNNDDGACCDAVSTSTLEKSTTTRTPPSKHKKKSVSFQNGISYRCTIPLHQYSQEEIKACWVSQEELKTIRSDIKFAVSLLDNGYLDKDTEKHCQRGLEAKTTIGALRRKRLQIAACEAILDEQNLQYDQYGYIFEPFLIALAYQSISILAMEKARSIALKDELDAMV